MCINVYTQSLGTCQSSFVTHVVLKYFQNVMLRPVFVTMYGCHPTD